MKNDIKILIVGAGIAGFSVYRALKIHGFSPKIVEKHHELKKGTGGLLLTSNAVDAIKRLGVFSSVMAHAFDVKALDYLDNKGNKLLTFNRQAHFPTASPFIAVHRNQLLVALSEGVSNDHLKFNVNVTQITKSNAGQQVTFADGSHETYDVVIGADGINSQIRQLANLSYQWEHTRVSCIRLITNRLPDLDKVTYMIGQGRAASFLPIDNLHMYCPFVFDNSLLKPLDALSPLQTVKTLFRDFADPMPQLFNTLPDSVEISPITPFSNVKLPHWHDDRTVLIGDAAHALIPTQPQGAAMALEDAVVLAEVLSTENSLAKALDSFEARRRDRLEAIQREGMQRAKTISLSTSRLGMCFLHTMAKFRGEQRLKQQWAPLINVDA